MDKFMIQNNLKKIGLAFLLAIFLGFSSQITIPLIWVPITGQTLAVGLIASIFGLTVGIESLSIYILMGWLGLPVFANAHAGLSVLLGPTGGYIWGFLVYILLVRLINRDHNSWQLGIANLSAATIQLIIGAVWLMFAAPMTLPAAIENGILPFLVPGLIKITIICGITMLSWRYLPKLNPINK